MKVYPVPGRVVRDPITGREVTDPLGEEKNEDSFWIRRVEDGDVTTKPAKPATAKGQE